MNNVLLLSSCKRRRLWVYMIAGLYGRQGYRNRVRIPYDLS